MFTRLSFLPLAAISKFLFSTFYEFQYVIYFRFKCSPSHNTHTALMRALETYTNISAGYTKDEMNHQQKINKENECWHKKSTEDCSYSFDITKFIKLSSDCTLASITKDFGCVDGCRVRAHHFIFRNSITSN